MASRTLGGVLPDTIPGSMRSGSDAMRQTASTPNRQAMLKVLALQIVVVVTVAMLGTPFWGLHGLRDALLGGAACFIPNALFAWRLWAAQGRPARSFVFAFFLGELIKVALTLVMLMTIVKWVTPVYWAAMLLGMVAALQAPWMLALFQRHRWFNTTGEAVGQTGPSRQSPNQISQ